MPQPVGTLIKAMNVLDALGEVAPIGVLDLSRRLGMDKSTVSRILTTLKSRGYVHVREGGQYDIGLRLFELGQALQERMPVREALMPHVDTIAGVTGETVFAMHYSQGQIAYLYDCVSSKDIRLGGRTGLRAAPWNHPAGHAILAYRDETEVLASLSAARRDDRQGLPTVDWFRQELKKVRKRGFAVQRDSEKCLISVPLRNDVIERADAAIMLGGPQIRLPKANEKNLAGILTEHARQVSERLGWIKQVSK